MKRLIIPLLLVALGWNLALALSAATLYLPIARSAPPASICDPSVPLLDQDTGSLSAGLDATGRYIIAYQDRAHGSRAHVVAHVGTHLEELPTPPLASLTALAPFSPDGAKQGSLALVLTPSGANRLYYTQRKAGDLTGPYALWCLDF